MAGKSRVSREAHARFCERLGVKFPGATRPRSELSEEAIAELKQRAPVLIPEFVRNLNA